MVVWSALHSKLPVLHASPLSQMPRSCNAMPGAGPHPCLYITSLLRSLLFNFTAQAADTLCRCYPSWKSSLEDSDVLGLKKIALPWRFNTLRYLTRFVFPFWS